MVDQFRKRGFAEEWDDLVGWKERAKFEDGFVPRILNRFGCKSVLDVATGTGFHAVMLREAGLEVTAADISKNMLAVAARNAKKHSVKINMVCSNWSDLRQKIPGKFDAIVCLGNSPACEMDEEQRRLAVLNWAQMLNEGGIIIVDRRNYEALLAGEYNHKARSPYAGKNVKINAEIVQEGLTVFAYTFSSGNTYRLQMYPLRNKELQQVFRQANKQLTQVDLYGDLQPRKEGDKKVAFYTYVFQLQPR